MDNETPNPNECDPACNENQTCKDGACVDNVITCPDSQELCGTVCRDTTKEIEHCGACDNPCTDGRVCINAQCEFVCEGSLPNKCDDGCFDFQTDVNHCGNCTTKCGDDKTCENGACVKVCENAGEIACGTNEECTDPMTDNANCGACGVTCNAANNESCMGGTCKKTCESGQELCDDGKCYDLDSDATCGACGNTTACDTSNNLHCSSNRTCETACPDGNDPNILMFVNFNTDPKHCGGCGNACNENELCSNGECSPDCADDEVEYKGICIKKNDPTHCGIGTVDREGGIDCTALAGVVEATCEEGKCVISKCAENFAVCDDNPNACTDLTKPEHCGSCGSACNDPNADASKTLCLFNAENPAESTCQFTCQEGMTSCDGSCKKLENDKDNCGWCGNKCGDLSPDAVCEAGFCVINSQCEDKYVPVTVNEQEIKAYCIKTEAALRAMRDAINLGKPYPEGNVNNAYIVMSNLKMGDDENWTPIGTQSNPFDSGYFLGNGKTISAHFTLKSAYSGLFGTVKSSVLSGLNLKIDITGAGSSYSGALAGELNNSIASYVTVTGKHESMGYRHGGIVGTTSGTTKLDHVRFNGSLDVKESIAFASPADTGGIIGWGSASIDYCEINVDMKNARGCSGGVVGSGNPNINHCTVSGTITADTSYDAVGGVVGNNGVVSNSVVNVTINASGKGGGVAGVCGRACSSIDNVIVTGDITCDGKNCAGLTGSSSGKIMKSGMTGKVISTGNYVGGLVGVYSGTMDNCYSTGNVDGVQYVGGLVGDASNAKITNSYTTGNISATSSKSVTMTGGIAGHSSGSTFENVYTIGNVKGFKYIGGIIGDMNSSTLSNCASFGDVTSQVFGTDSGDRIGTIIGTAHYGSNISNCFGTGNVKGANNVGGFIGRIGVDGVNIRNVYSTGTASGTTETGAFAGFTQTAGASIKNSYYWKDSHEKDIGSGTAETKELFAFFYNDNKDTVLVNNEERSLVDSLGDDWTTATCEFKSGSEKIARLPVPKTLNAPICGN